MTTTVADKAYDIIKEAIIQREYFPGCRLIEENLVEKCGVSRTGVRKALNQLEYEGLVDTTSGHGATVKLHTADEVRSLFAARETLEIGAFQMAVKKITPERIARMKGYNAKLEEVSKDFKISEYAKWNKAFHYEIALATENKYYEKFMLEILNNIEVCLLFYNIIHDDKRSIEFHNQIIKAFETKDYELGKAAIVWDNKLAPEDANQYRNI